MEMEQDKEYNFPKKLKAVIFDMDDLMVDSAAVHQKVFEKVLNKYGASLSNAKNPLTKEEITDWYGRKISDIFVGLHKKYKLEGKTTPEQMNNEFNEMLLPIFEQDVQEMPGVREVIGVLKNKYRLALASSAKKAKIAIVLEKLSASDAFEVIISGEDEIKNGKPAPDIYLKTAEKLGLDPSECVVLEDAKNGVEAAKAAGMHVIGVHNQFAYQRLGIRQDLHVADLEVDSLNQVGALFSENG